MESLEHLKHLFLHADWADRELLAELRRTEDAPPEAAATLAHLVGTGFLWLSRIRGEPSPIPVWPELDPAASSARLDELRDAWRELLADLAPEELARPVAYRNSKGEPWTSTVGVILTHVVLHGAYHRGQVARVLRGAGVEPPYTDYVHAVRHGLL